MNPQIGVVRLLAGVHGRTPRGTLDGKNKGETEAVFLGLSVQERSWVKGWGGGGGPCRKEALVGPSPRVKIQDPQWKGSRVVDIVGADSEAFCPTHRFPTGQPPEKTPSVSWS